jgi:hypothetical protein
MKFRRLTSLLATLLGCSTPEEPPSPRPVGITPTASSPPTPPIPTSWDVTGGNDNTPEPPKPCVPEAMPPEVPEGWVQWLGLGCEAPFYLPPTPEHLPPPITWEPCPETPGCQQMPLDWAEHGGNALLGYDLHVDATDPLDPILQFTRVEGYIPTEPWHEEVTRTTVVARADGPVLHALFGHHYWKTSADTDTHFALGLMGADGWSALWFQAFTPVPNGYGGLIVWDVGGSLEPMVVNQANHIYQYHVGRDWFIRKASQSAGPAELMRPDGSDVRTLTQHDQQSGRVVGDKVVFRAKTPTGFGLFLWTEDVGEQLLVEYPYSEQKKIFELAADEEWMTYQVEDTSTDPPTTELFASPFPNTVGDFAPVALRSAPWLPGSAQATVGCGYVGRNRFVVRIDDGHTWFLPQSDREAHDTVLAMTCTEVFVHSRFWSEDHSTGYVTIARLPLEALGPGVPANEVPPF